MFKQVLSIIIVYSVYWDYVWFIIHMGITLYWLYYLSIINEIEIDFNKHDWYKKLFC